MKLIVETPFKQADLECLFYKIKSMASSEGLYDDVKPSESAKGLGFMLDILMTLQNGTPLDALGEEMRITRGGIIDEKVLIGFNMAIALCNKHLGRSEDAKDNS